MMSKKNQNIRYESRAALDLTYDEIKACSELFGTSYGMYDDNSPTRPGQQIKLSVKQYQKRYCKDGFFLVRAMDENQLVGHAWYIRRNYEPYGVITWVLQLVIHHNYRRQGIASTLLRSIWGFSNDFAWGLASANPCTVKTLESATFRKCNTAFIQKNLDAIRMIGKDTSFVQDDAYVVGDDVSQVDTAFFVDNSDYSDGRECEKKLGILRPGHEWLAFTFRDQKINKESYRRHFSKMMDGYEIILKDAYGRMNIYEHTWAKGTSNEVEFVKNFIPQKGSVLDLGCGIGRHAVALARMGYKVKAVDNASNLFQKTQREQKGIKNLSFVEGDAREFRDKKEYDAVLCLFDVIGSYPNIKDNQRIIKTAYDELKVGGCFILSVMNMELTKSIIMESHKGSIGRNPDILVDLPPSNTMQKSGAIFDARYLALDTERNLIYRKEQFDNDNGLPAEYIIRDKRYCADEITEMLTNAGLSVVDVRYVQAGHFDVLRKPTEKEAKEICVVCRKDYVSKGRKKGGLKTKKQSIYIVETKTGIVFRLSPSGEVIAESVGYSSERDCRKGILCFSKIVDCDMEYLETDDQEMHYPKYIVKHDESYGYRFELTAEDGSVVVVSPNYLTMEECIETINLIKTVFGRKKTTR